MSLNKLSCSFLFALSLLFNTFFYGEICAEAQTRRFIPGEQQTEVHFDQPGKADSRSRVDGYRHELVRLAGADILNAGNSNRSSYSDNAENKSNQMARMQKILTSYDVLF